MSETDVGFLAAVEEARQGFAEGGVPIAYIHVWNLKPTPPDPQGEISALENSGRLPASAYAGSTMYTTLSPCDMCTGACILYKVARVVVGENKTFVGGEDYLKARGVEVVVLENRECMELMRRFIEGKPNVWNEDIGEQ
ncbi:hypothetical protein AYO21_11901 [Fonsecaea monophora]|uniref:CMP/dCMP-type deaminase domain-containing protein n=1 Tax=Fonsecaea monophora TaxID=254056 RepID=A0A177ERQ3_9EURO|nr:hypothetical protein AYO21_11901 [Fonsecaea monophora]OAG33970.1 hypothetical protein AYO21_11901 [Fonsecaea monophora]